MNDRLPKCCGMLHLSENTLLPMLVTFATAGQRGRVVIRSLGNKKGDGIFVTGGPEATAIGKLWQNIAAVFSASWSTVMLWTEG